MFAAVSFGVLMIVVLSIFICAIYDKLVHYPLWWSVGPSLTRCARRRTDAALSRLLCLRCHGCVRSCMRVCACVAGR